MYAKLLNNGKH